MRNLRFPCVFLAILAALPSAAAAAQDSVVVRLDPRHSELRPLRTVS